MGRALGAVLVAVELSALGAAAQEPAPLPLQWTEARERCAEELETCKRRTAPGEVTALWALGHLYVEGSAVPRSYARAYILLSLAAARVAPDHAKATMDAIEDRLSMDPKVLVQIQREALAYHAELCWLGETGGGRSSGGRPPPQIPSAIRIATNPIAAISTTVR